MSEKRKCPQCGIVNKNWSDWSYSQGTLVCPDCKQNNQKSDKRAFDRDMEYRTNFQGGLRDE